MNFATAIGLGVLYGYSPASMIIFCCRFKGDGLGLSRLEFSIDISLAGVYVFLTGQSHFVIHSKLERVVLVLQLFLPLAATSTAHFLVPSDVVEIYFNDLAFVM